MLANNAGVLRTFQIENDNRPDQSRIRRKRPLGGRSNTASS